MVYWIGLALPVAYLGLLVGALATFSSLYRKRKAVNSNSLAPWFPPHLQRNIYLSLLHLEPEPGKEKAPMVPDSVLKAALLRRATEDIHRIMLIRGQKQALSSLLQRGSVGDDLWQRFQRAEKEVEEELKDVINEASAYAPNWGQTIFQSANEMAANSALRNRIEEIQGRTTSERQWWDKKRANIQSDFMKELGEDATSKPATPGERGSDEDTVMVEGGGPVAGKASSKKKKAKK